MNRRRLFGLPLALLAPTFPAKKKWMSETESPQFEILTADRRRMMYPDTPAFKIPNEWLYVSGEKFELG